MKKSVIMFIVFLIIDIILTAVLLNFNGGKDFVVLFLPAMFIEIAVYGSVILYEASKKWDKYSVIFDLINTYNVQEEWCKCFV